MTGGKKNKSRVSDVCNLSNPQSCENDWGEKGEEEDGAQGVKKRANFQLI